jgi:hypothetical protein
MTLGQYYGIVVYMVSEPDGNRRMFGAVEQADTQEEAERSAGELVAEEVDKMRFHGTVSTMMTDAYPSAEAAGKDVMTHVETLARDLPSKAGAQPWTYTCRADA